MERRYPSESEYRHVVTVCEMLFGQPESYYKKSCDLGKVESISFDKYHVLLTGLHRNVYRTYFDINVFDYISRFTDTENEVQSIFRSQGIQYITTMIVYDHSKRMCVIFNTPEGVSPDDAAEIVASCFNRLYASIFDMSKTPYRNYTVLSEEIHGYENLQSAFREIDALSRQQYFDMRTMVMTPSLLEGTRIPADAEQIHEELIRMYVAMRAGDVDEMIAKYRAVMAKLELARDFNLLEDTLASMRHTLEGVMLSHGIEPDERMREMFAVESYPTFQLQRDAIEAYLKENLARLGDTRPMSQLIQEAVRYIRHHYAEDIAVADVAEHIGMSASWLTKRFKQECGENILSCLLNVRVEHAKALLVETDLPIREIADAVGFETSGYFSSVFGRAVGIAPKAYREEHKK